MTYKLTGDAELDDLIKKVHEITHCSVDTAKTALFDCDNDINNAVAYVFEHNEKFDSWQTSGGQKNKQTKPQPPLHSQETARPGNNKRNTDRPRELRGDRQPFNKDSAVKDRRSAAAGNRNPPRPKATFGHKQSAPKDTSSQRAVESSKNTSDNSAETLQTPIEAWNGEAIKIFNSDSAIALESCLEPTNEPPVVTNGHAHYEMQSHTDIMTKDVISKKPPTATVFSLLSPVTVSNIAFDRRPLDNHARCQVTFGDEECRKRCANWQVETGRQGSYLVDVPIPKIVDTMPLSAKIASDKNVGITMEQITSILNTKKKQEESPTKQTQNVFTAAAAVSNKSVPHKTFNNFQPPPTNDFAKVSLHDQTQTATKMDSNVVPNPAAPNMQVPPTAVTTLPAAVHHMTQQYAAAAPPQSNAAHFVSQFGNAPPQSSHQLYHQTGYQTNYGQSTPQQTASVNSVDQNYYSFNQMMQQQQRMFPRGQSGLAQALGQPHNHAIHPHGLENMGQFYSPPAAQQLYFINSYSPNPAQATNETVVSAAAGGFIKPGPTNVPQQATSGGHGSNSYHQQHDSGMLDSGKYHHGKSMNYKSGGQGGYGRGASDGNPNKMDNSQSIYGGYMNQFPQGAMQTGQRN